MSNISFSKQNKADQVFIIINYFILSLLTLSVLYPLVYIVSASISQPAAVLSGKVWLYPVEPTIEGYKSVFRHKLILSGYTNSIFYTIFGTMINVVMTVLAAYPLSRRDLMGRGWLTMLFVFTMLFSGGLIPTFLVVKQLGMLNTPWAMLIPAALSVWNVIIAKTYFQTTIPDEVLEAAQLDGCSDIQFVTRIVLPLSKPIIAVISLFYAVGHWNQFFSALIYLSDQKLYPLQIVLRDILTLNELDLTMFMDGKEAAALEGMRELIKFALIVVASVPVMLIYPFVQKYFVKGIMLGSLKG